MSKCNWELEEYNNSIHNMECIKCDFKDNRGWIAIANITKKFLMKLWETRLKLLLGFEMNKNQNLEEG